MALHYTEQETGRVGISCQALPSSNKNVLNLTCPPANTLILSGPSSVRDNIFCFIHTLASKKYHLNINISTILRFQMIGACLLSLLHTITQFNGDMLTMLTPLGEYQSVGDYLRDREIAPQLKEATSTWCSLAQVCLTFELLLIQV